MLCHDVVAAPYDDLVRVGTDLDRPLHRLRHHRVSVAIKTDEAGVCHGMVGLVKAIERRQDRLKDRTFGFQSLSDCPFLLLGMRVIRHPAKALRLQPSIQFL